MREIRQPPTSRSLGSAFTLTSAPPLTIAPGTNPGSLMLSWPTAGGSGYSIFESHDLQAWEPSPLVPTISDGHDIAEPIIGPDPRKFWRIEPTGSTQ